MILGRFWIFWFYCSRGGKTSSVVWGKKIRFFYVRKHGGRGALHSEEYVTIVNPSYPVHDLQAIPLVARPRDNSDKELHFVQRPHSAHFMLEFPGAMVYLSGMSQTLEKRVEELEKKVAELSGEVLQLRPIKKDWRRTVGCMPADELQREAV